MANNKFNSEGQNRKESSNKPKPITNSLADLIKQINEIGKNGNSEVDSPESPVPPIPPRTPIAA
jgi:hypothetical protein